MYKFFTFIAVAIAISWLAYAFWVPVERTVVQNVQNVVRLKNIYAPCSDPITYSFGLFDARFGISQDTLKQAVVKAIRIWDEPINKELFTYDSAGVLKINLIYDYRQEATQTLKKLGLVVSDTRASYDALKTKYEAMRSDYLQKKSAYDLDVAALRERQDVYNQKVAYWNDRDGAPKDEYNFLNQERDAINGEVDALNQKLLAVNMEIDDVNALVVTLNRLASVLNLNVEQYNEVGQARGREFEEGLYKSGPGGQEIDVYQFDGNAKLIRVLAHEFGHALGLAHSNDSKAIMYRLNQGTNETLTHDDLLALKQHCGIK